MLALGMAQEMRQCLLTRTSCYQCGKDEHVAWLPSTGAKVGRVVDLKMAHGWSEGWTIAEVYGLLVSYEYIREHERDYKIQREASDI